MKIEPFDDLILVRPYELSDDSPILVSAKTKARSMPYVLAEVIAVGKGRELECGKRRDMNIKPGDKVMFSAGAPIFPIERKHLNRISRLNGAVDLPAQALINVGHLLGVVETDAKLEYADELPSFED